MRSLRSRSNRRYEILCVSQFTLYGTINKKQTPDFKLAMPGDPALEAYTAFKALVAELHGDASKVKDGAFGQHMDVQIANDGPVTLIVDSLPERPADAAPPAPPQP